MKLRHIFAVLSLCSATFTAQAALDSCPLIAPVTLTNPQVIGDGTPTSCNVAALQAAVAQGGHISFNCGFNPVTINLTEQLDISVDTVIDGGNLVTLDGGNKTRLIDKKNTANLTVQNITLRNGKAPSGSGLSERSGGAILASGAGTSLTVINSTLIDNSVTKTDDSDVAGGAIYAFGIYEVVVSDSVMRNNKASNGGAIGSLASGVRVINSQLIGNKASGRSGGLRGLGGAIYIDDVTNKNNPDSNHLFHICGSVLAENEGDLQGGATFSVFSDGEKSQMIVDQSLFENNNLVSNESSTGQGGAIYHQEDNTISGNNEDNFHVLNSTFVGNGCFAQGAAIWTLIEGRITIENSTFLENQLRGPNSMGAGIALLRGKLTLNNSTFAANEANFQGGGMNRTQSTTLNMANTVFLNNTGNNQLNIEADTDGGGNIQFLESRREKGTAAKLVSSKAVFADPLLGGIAYNGGLTPGLKPLDGSPLIGAGTTSRCPTNDQRGMTRGQCDSGAVAFGDLPMTFQAAPQFSGSLANASLNAQLSVMSQDAGQNGYVYVAAQVGSTFYFHNGTTWVALDSFDYAFPYYYRGALQNANLPILQNMNVSGLGGTAIYMGYGRTQADMMNNGKVALLYLIP